MSSSVSELLPGRDCSNQYETRRERAYVCIKRALEQKNLIALPLIAHAHLGTVLNEKYPLMEHQNQAVAWLIDRDQVKNVDASTGGLLIMGVGSGKTLCMLVLIMSTLHNQRQCKQSTLMVCPTNILQTVQAEIKKFYHGIISSCILHREYQKEWKEFVKFTNPNTSLPDIVLVSYATLTQSIPNRWFAQRRWYRVVLDESHYIANPSSHTFACVSKLVASRRYCMTGTPVVRSSRDMLSQMMFTGILADVSHKRSLGGKRQVYKKNWFQHPDVKPWWILIPYQHGLVNGVPRPAHVVIHYQLNPIEQSITRIQNKTTLRMFRRTELAKGIEKAMGVLRLHRMLRRLLCHLDIHKHVQDISAVPTRIQRFISLLLNLRKQTSTKKIVVFANSADSLEHAFSWLPVDIQETTAVVHHHMKSLLAREKKYSEFSNDKSILFTTMQSSGTGLNLQHANVVIFLDVWHEASLIQQCIGRVQRIGQNHFVRVFVLVGVNTIEECVQELAWSKLVHHDASADDLASVWWQDFEHIFNYVQVLVQTSSGGEGEGV